MGYRAVIFDIGGVVVDSPLHVIARYERELGLPAGCVNQVVMRRGEESAWARLERGELTLEEFYPVFDRECREDGYELSGREMMARIDAECQPRESVLTAILRLRDEGLRTAALTNNWVGNGVRLDALRVYFDTVVESARVGLRKPDPRIYQLTCEELGVRPPESVFLDDIGRNLKPARALGMHTIRVQDPGAALRELESALGLSLLSPP